MNYVIIWCLRLPRSSGRWYWGDFVAELLLLLFLFHETPDFVMAADHEKNNFIGELKQNAILESGPDFPIIGMPVLQAKAGL